MINYVCDRCGQKVQRRDLRSGTVEHLTEAYMHFELCGNCYTCLKVFLRGDAVAGVGTDQQNSQQAATA